MSDQGYYVSEAEQIRLLRARLETAEKALQRIAEYETDWTQGPAANVNALQAIAESALGQGQGKEPIITGSSLEPTDRAQSREAVTGAWTAEEVAKAKAYAASIADTFEAAPPDPVPGAMKPGQRCTRVAHADDEHMFAAHVELRWDFPSGQSPFGERCPYVEPSRPPLEPPCETCSGEGGEWLAVGLAGGKSWEPCPRCRPPEVPTCESWCGTKATCHNGRTCWHVYGLCWCSESCHSLGHPRHPAPREGER